MDHISALPNDVISHIFSFLPFKDVVKTSALSRGWRHTWTTATPQLEFDGVRNLVSLCVSGTWYPLEGREDISIDNGSSLVEAKLDFVIPTGGPGDKRMCGYLLKELLERLRGVPTITIGGWCFQVLSHLEMEGVPSPLSKCQNLILEAPVSELNLPGIAYMLQSSQCLEKLVIRLTNLPRSKFGHDEESEDRVNFDGEELLCLQSGNSGRLAEHLKSVEISGTGADRFVLALLKFLLRDEVVQGKLIKEQLVIEVKVPTHFVPGKLLGAKKKSAQISKSVRKCRGFLQLVSS